MKRFFFLSAVVAVSLLATTSAKADWVDTPGPTVKGLTCSKVVDEEEDFDDLVQAAARTLGGRKTGPVQVQNILPILIG